MAGTCNAGRAYVAAAHAMPALDHNGSGEPLLNGEFAAQKCTYSQKIEFMARPDIAPSLSFWRARAVFFFFRHNNKTVALAIQDDTLGGPHAGNKTLSQIVLRGWQAAPETRCEQGQVRHMMQYNGAHQRPRFTRGALFFLSRNPPCHASRGETSTSVRSHATVGAGGDSRRIQGRLIARAALELPPNNASEIFLHMGARAGSSLIEEEPPKDACGPPL